ncbi:unnamed protein product, partial [Nesidiocoris tenuis]
MFLSFFPVFIAEGGPECLTSNIDHIQNCLNETLGSYVEGGATSETISNLTDSGTELLLDEKQCG